MKMKTLNFIFYIVNNIVCDHLLPYLKLNPKKRCSVKKVFVKISQNSQENTCARVSFYYFREYFEKI